MNSWKIGKIEPFWDEQYKDLNYIKWCRELFWWGRKEGRYKSIMENKSDIQKTSMG